MLQEGLRCIQRVNRMPIKTTIKSHNTKTEDYLNNAIKTVSIEKLKKIADKSLHDFVVASPTTEIAVGWSYEIVSDFNKLSLIFNNSANQNGENIAIIIDVGHGTKDGHWVSGKHYLDKPIQKTYERIINETWEALRKYDRR